jgi:hypothetical protein
MSPAMPPVLPLVFEVIVSEIERPAGSAAVQRPPDNSQIALCVEGWREASRAGI